MNDQNTSEYFHSVRLIEDKCKGCVTCIKHCPTEAIRVREGKAKILEVKCVDCGECVRICPNQAKEAVADTLDKIQEYRYKIALPAPALFGQFRGGIQPERILAGLMSLGFDDVFEVGYGAEFVSGRIREILQDPDRPRPLLSSSCPAVIRLIQVRFPEFIGNIAPVASPMRVASRLAIKQATEELGIPREDIGLFFISPCPGKVSAIMDPVGYDGQCVDGAIPISEIYGKIHNFVYNATDDEVGKKLRRASGVGLGWGRAGGEAISIGAKKLISVDGIHHVIQIMEEIGHGKLLDMDYIEVLACVGGCVGGVLTVENPFISRRRLRELASQDAEESEKDIADRQANLIKGMNKSSLEFDRAILPRPMMTLDDDIAVAIQKMEKIDQLLETLPGIDCGSCGAPNCRALAEDIIRGLAVETDCVFRLRDRVSELAHEMGALASKVPPAMGTVRRDAEDANAVGDSQGIEPESKD